MQLGERFEVIEVQKRPKAVHNRRKRNVLIVGTAMLFDPVSVTTASRSIGTNSYGRRQVINVDAARSHGHLIQPYDLLLCFRGSVGRVLLVHGIEQGTFAIPSTGICIIRLQDLRRSGAAKIMQGLLVWFRSAYVVSQLQLHKKRRKGNYVTTDEIEELQIPAFTMLSKIGTIAYKRECDLVLLQSMIAAELAALRDWDSHALPRPVYSALSRRRLDQMDLLRSWIRRLRTKEGDHG